MAGFEERRKSPRVAVGGQYVFRADQRVRVRLLDISAGGALLQTEERLPVGGVGKLRLSLAGAPFETTVEVKREEPAADLRGRVAGVFIVAMQPREQDALEDFLRRAGS
ncbi:MAG TPA: PilZ domain-containing protein [Acidimicrobiales bacterium]|nr:PilZ domain-containing protein [Acidimicrobiales bacterium]